MRVCHCILGKNGKCCQDTKSQTGWGITTDKIVGIQPLKVPFGETHRWASGMYSNTGKGRVWKTVQGRWAARNIHIGSQVFDTWAEAMKWAVTPMMTWNTAV